MKLFIKDKIGLIYIKNIKQKHEYLVSETNLVKMILHLALGVFGLIDAFLEGKVDLTALFPHVIRSLL